MAARSFLGAGDVYVDRIVADVRQGLTGPIYAGKLALKPNVDTKQSTSKGRYDYGQVLDSVNLGQPGDISIDFKQVTGDVLLMALMGTGEAYSQTGAALAATQFVATKLDTWIVLGKKDFTTIVVKDQAGTVTFVEGEDYVVNKPMGLVKPLSTGDIEAGDTLTISGAFGTVTGGTLIRGGTRAEVRCYILFDGINQADGSEVTVEIWEAVISAESEFDFLADDFNEVSVSGTMKTPPGKTEPYTVLLKKPAA